MRREPGRVRWWPAATILVLGALGVLWASLSSPEHRQGRLLNTVLVLVLTGLLLAIWLAFFSRVRWRVRGPLLAVLFAAGIVLAFSVRFRGPSGDVLPLFEWRWSRSAEAAQALPANPAPATDVAAPPGAADYPQFMGPRRDGTLDAPRLARDWPADLQPRWRIPMGAGWSAFAVAGGRAVTQEQRGDEETVTCYDLATGALLWAHADTARHEDGLGGPGPRATPSIVGERVFAQGATGILNALDLRTGKRIWSRNVLDDAGARPPTYGLSTSPLVVDDRVIVVAGGDAGRSLLAYDLASGEPLWSGGSDPAAYSSPLLTELGGVRQVVVLNNAAVAGHALADGRVLWRYAFDANERVAQPVIVPGDRVLVSAGYGVGAKLIAVRADGAGSLTAALVWESLALKAKFTDVVLRGGTLYGLDDGILAAVDVETGERLWKRGRYGHGQIVLVGDLLVVQAEDGAVILVDVSAAAPREAGRIAALDDRTWNHPALAGRYLLVRNDREAACFELPLAAAP